MARRRPLLAERLTERVDRLAERLPDKDRATILDAISAATFEDECDVRVSEWLVARTREVGSDDDTVSGPAAVALYRVLQAAADGAVLSYPVLARIGALAFCPTFRYCTLRYPEQSPGHPSYPCDPDCAGSTLAAP